MGSLQGSVHRIYSSAGSNIGAKQYSVGTLDPNSLSIEKCSQLFLFFTNVSLDGMEKKEDSESMNIFY